MEIIAGYLFHLMQNIKKKVANCGLLTAFKNEPKITLQVRMVGALAFVPPGYVSAAFEQLQETLDARLDPLVEYFEDNYIGRLSRRGRKIPPFPISWWNVYDRTLEGAHRSNNYSEAAHRRLHYEMNVTHPSIWKFISALCRIQKGRDIYFDELNCGDGPPRKRTKYMRLDERLLNKVSSFDDTTPHIHLDYLRGVAFNLMSD
ncbi:hypothetical protein V9T40_014824 [Parthenolecanium corni]|uniref:Uncharacterized protein n=1 Tax=Parthenolecanium corni TaxID=536013 RepID=A0AAN9XX45_9HEMI